MRTADVIAIYHGKLVLIERLGSPKGLAFPGGKVEADEEASTTAQREFFEETGLTLDISETFGIYSGKDRDPRFAESMTMVFLGVATGTLRNEQGKTKVCLCSFSECARFAKEQFAFDHHQILSDYLENR